MELTILQKHSSLFVDSREIANILSKRHSHLIRDIERYISVLNKFNEPKVGSVKFFISSTYIDEKGEKRPCYLCTRKGCDMIAHKMTGDKGVIFTATYIEKFYQMEWVLLEKQTAEWQLSRTQSKLSRKSETDVIKQLVEYAKSQGSEHADKLYMTYSMLANRAVGITDRNTATTEQLQNLRMVENIIFHAIADGLNQKLPYKDVYNLCKAKVNALLDIAYINNYTRTPYHMPVMANTYYN